MSCFVMVHGGWHGGWCWTPVARFLRAMGHEVHAPSLTGLGDRRHLASPEINPDTHVLDITTLIDSHELHDVVLVGHSYAGLVIAGVAGRMPERMVGLVYLDAVIPLANGISPMERRCPERLAAFRAQMTDGRYLVDPDQTHSWSDDPVTRDWSEARCTGQPIRCLTEGVTLTGREHEVERSHYILATRNNPSLFWEEYDWACGRAGWSVDCIPTRHDAMVEAPDDLAMRLHGFAVSADAADRYNPRVREGLWRSA